VRRRAGRNHIEGRWGRGLLQRDRIIAVLSEFRGWTPWNLMGKFRRTLSLPCISGTYVVVVNSLSTVSND
jgi:hypothetical protein